MIVSALFDLLNTTTTQLGWCYYLFLDRCNTHGWKLITEELYTTWKVSEGKELQRQKNSTSYWNYKYDEKAPNVTSDVDTIPQKVLDEYKKEFGCLYIDKMLTERCERFEKCLSEILDKYEAIEPIDAIIVYPKIPRSLQYLAQKRNIPLYAMEVAPLRAPIYRGAAYLSHHNQLWRDEGELEDLYNMFLKEHSQKPLPILSNKSLLALFLSPQHFKYLSLLNVPPVSEALCIGTYTMNPSDYAVDWNQSLKLIKKLQEKYGDTFLYRPDPGDPYQATYRISDKQLSREQPNIISMLKCKRAFCSSSNMLFEAMLWKRMTYCDTKNFGLWFMSNHTDSWEDKLAPIEFLNFFCFAFIVPMEISTTNEYVRWRLTNPSLSEIYLRHLEYYLSYIGLSMEDVINNKEEDFIKKVALVKKTTLKNDFEFNSNEKPFEIWDRIFSDFGLTKPTATAAIVKNDSSAKELQELLNSRSWKITAPLRKAASFARKIKSNIKK